MHANCLDTGKGVCNGCGKHMISYKICFQSQRAGQPCRQRKKSRRHYLMPLQSTTTPVGLTVQGAPPEPLSIPKQDTKAAQGANAPLSAPNGEEVEILQASIK